jgi:hypothetical protein
MRRRQKLRIGGGAPALNAAYAFASPKKSLNPPTLPPAEIVGTTRNLEKT